MTSHPDKTNTNTPVSRGTIVITILFAAACLTLFIAFILRHPVDWPQPETLRLHYYALQSNLKDGPLSSHLLLNDLYKPLVWEAQGGMFDARYPSMLLDALIPKLYQLIYPATGPFLSEPVNIILILCSVILLIRLINEWFGSWPAAISTGAWLITTSQTLLDARYPIRPNMALLVLLFLICLYELISLRRRKKAAGPAWRLGIALGLAWFTHEYTIVFLPIIILVVVFEWKSLRRHIITITVAVVSATAVYFISLLFILPSLAEWVTGERPDMSWMIGGGNSIELTRAALIGRFRDYVLVGIGEMLRQTLGCGIFLPLFCKLSGLAITGLVLFLMRKKSWVTALPTFLIASAFYILIALVVFPVIPPTVEMPVYYYAPIIMLFMLPLGGLLSGLHRRGDEWRWGLACSALLLIGLQNARHSDIVMKGMPGDFGCNPSMREYVRDILDVPDWIVREEITGSIYTAYPRPKNFDISRRWDIMLRVWHGESEQVFSMMMPVLNLRLYESRKLLGDPEEFSATTSMDPYSYESEASIYWEMPRRRLYDLKRIKESVQRIKDGSRRIVWTNSESREVVSVKTGSLLGNSPRALLPPGSWKLNISPPANSDDSSRIILLLLRADLMPGGSEDVMNRETPIRLRECVLSLLESETGDTIFSKSQTYGWSYQLFQINIPPPPYRNWELVVEGTAPVEVIGPVFINTDSILFSGYMDRSSRSLIYQLGNLT